MDHIRQGKSLKHFVTPPAAPSRDTVIDFRDGLSEIIPFKLEELLERRERLIEKREEALSFVNQKTAVGSGEEYFLVLLAEHEFSEAYYIQKWIKYWLTIWYQITGKHAPEKLQKRLSGFNEFELEKARQHPLEDLYDGQFRRSGLRLEGLCPFHKEKTPSFYIFPDNHWFCFGACNEGGDAINFVMKLKNLTFPEAVRYLL